jgi:hypothetical protein
MGRVVEELKTVIFPEAETSDKFQTSRLIRIWAPPGDNPITINAREARAGNRSLLENP